MPSSVFSSDLPDGLVEEFITTLCDNTNVGKLVIDRTTYKRALFENTLYPFLSLLTPHYYDSTQFYLTRKMTYTRFLTIMRQLLRYCKINYTTCITHTSTRKEVTLVLTNMD
jgi:hypothetical protein